MTVDGDGVNDVFIVQHLEDYDAAQLRIFNRWGNLIYENEAYQNDWSGTDLSGKKMVDGVYFYTVVPQSAKYTYDDQEKTQFTLHGFVHVFNK